MLHVLSVWLLVAAFFGAGLFNAISTQTTKSSFIRWGYPPKWCCVTGGLELVVAVLVALPGSREAGLILGAAIVNPEARPRDKLCV